MADNEEDLGPLVARDQSKKTAPSTGIQLKICRAKAIHLRFMKRRRRMMIILVIATALIMTAIINDGSNGTSIVSERCGFCV